jgi:NitT/TauT family transport system ATP-binding protein/sulfonate transport system ATP-binding protein
MAEGSYKMVGEIKVEGVVKRFPQQDAEDVVALSGIDLTIAAGEFVSLIGPSGCGKSTLLRLIAGLNGADEGKLYIDGEVIRQPSYERGLVFQNPMLFPWLNVHDNVAFGLKARSIYKHNKPEVEKFIDLVGLATFHKSYPHQLSGGMAQRASLARALVNHPKVLLLDEPLGALDAFTRMNMQDELIRIWQERQTTMIMVTHDVDEAIYLSDRVIVMTPRPAKIESCIEVQLSRPRARNNPEFLRMRSKILEILNFAGSVKEPNYYL